MLCKNGHYFQGEICKTCKSEPKAKKPKKLLQVVSKSNFVHDSQGNHYTRGQANERIREAKQKLNDSNIDKQYCWSCGITGVQLDWSHIISVKKCNEDGRAEWSWMPENMQRECRNGCHLETEVRNFSHHANARIKNEIIKKYNLNK